MSLWRVDAGDRCHHGSSGGQTDSRVLGAAAQSAAAQIGERAGFCRHPLVRRTHRRLRSDAARRVGLGRLPPPPRTDAAPDPDGTSARATRLSGEHGMPWTEGRIRGALKSPRNGSFLPQFNALCQNSLYRTLQIPLLNSLSPSIWLGAYLTRLRSNGLLDEGGREARAAGVLFVE